MLTPNTFGRLRDYLRTSVAGIIAVIAANAPAPGAVIAPQNATTTTFQEVVLVDFAKVFSDTAGTVALTGSGVGQTVGAIRDVAGNMAATFPSGAQPTFQIDSQSGNGALSFDGAATYGVRSNVAEAATVAVIYSADMAGKHARPSVSTLLAQPGPIVSSANTAGYALALSNASGSLLGADVVQFSRYRSDASTATVNTGMVVGHTECLMMIGDGTTYSHYKSGAQDKASPTTATGTPSALLGSSATIGAALASDGTTKSNYFKGLVLGWAVSSGKLGTSEIPGVSQWMVNRAAQKQTLTGWLGAFFQGDGSPSERAASHNSVFKHFSADLTQSEYRPSAEAGLSQTTGFYADYGLATNGSAYFMTRDGAGDSVIPLLTSSDGFNWTRLASISTSGVNGSTGYPIGGSFARKIDNTIYTDAQGCAYLFFDGTYVAGGASSGNSIFVVKSTDNTWVAGGTWGTPVLCTGFTGNGANSIDPSVMQAADGTFVMAYSDYKEGTGNVGGGQIRYATAPTITGTWTLAAAADAYGLGSSVEGPQLVNLGTATAPNFALLFDREGHGYSVATLGNLLTNAATNARSIPSGDAMEQGEIAPMLSGFPNPLLQASTSTRAYRWEGKGILVSGNPADGLTVNGSSASGWQRNYTVGSGGSVTISNKYAVPDPNGDLTASTIAFGGTSTSSYAFIGCQSIEGIGSGGNLAGNIQASVWVRGRAGGEVIGFQVGKLGSSTPAPIGSASITLTTAWTRLEIVGYLPLAGSKAVMSIGCQNSSVASQAIDICWPTLK
ncbi:hypothetical protein [uncultured Sphingomonas sp.]|uniref:hypothetical protein n=1 Tax=uncultured Sphingomonas sp. TaxID=158754 RepID=UPI00262392B5|nr:hypothetical protein [uncultured Sphingomonas sp.]